MSEQQTNPGSDLRAEILDWPRKNSRTRDASGTPENREIGNLPAKSREIDGANKIPPLIFKPGDDCRGRRAWLRTRVRVWKLLVERELSRIGFSDD
ncbi:hypothetical protein L484_024079 [Morus notabilis]|uniref:Uncharacterized protein n=1 Tax=Morus notabilis TaxID=981085 RepID=W9RXX0_9ROSA|nr:hypothetical protein L484_024079 [Morus notabilis]